MQLVQQITVPALNLSLKLSYLSSLKRLLHPRSIAVVGGKEAATVIQQCDLLGFEGEIWPVNPNRNQIESRPCYKSVHDLPAVPDAAFIAVPQSATIEVISQLSAIGAGGAVCYASGFAEVGGEGAKFQHELDVAMGNMPVIGPNCYGVINYQSGVALWPDQQGGIRCKKGVAIISQSGNITVSLSMQRRGVPVAFLISTGNMSGVKVQDYIYALLENPDITAIGFYLEGMHNAVSFSEAAIAALKKNVAIVVIESGQSEIGASVNLSHSHSLSGESVISSAFYQRYGIIQVYSIPQLLETLKFISVLPTDARHTIASISCSGGEAALMADLAVANGLEFAEFSSEQNQGLYEILGDRVNISNPLDYHTYIWGDQVQQQACFKWVYEGEQALNINVFDYPAEGVCETQDWDFAIDAIIGAKQASDAQVAVASTLHENFPTRVQNKLLANGIAPMLGVEECVQAVSLAAKYAQRCEQANTLQPLVALPTLSKGIYNLTEYEGKQILKLAGVPVVEGQIVDSFEGALAVVDSLGYPVVAKISSASEIHKTEIGGVVLNLQNEFDLKRALDSLSQVGKAFLIEEFAPQPHAELMIGVRVDPTFGRVLTLGAGGRLAELINDVAVLLFPVGVDDIRSALIELKIGKLLCGHRDKSGDIETAVEVIANLCEFVNDAKHNVNEIEINPLFVYQDGVVVVDVVYSKFIN